MTKTFDTKPYYEKLARNEPIAEAEVLALLKRVVALEMGWPTWRRARPPHWKGCRSRPASRPAAAI